MLSFHSDTHGIALGERKSIPSVSDTRTPRPYHSWVTEDPVKTWGKRLRVILKKKKIRQPWIAEKMGVADSTLRSWLNGNRPIQFDDLRTICKLADVHLSLVLFDAMPMDTEMKRRIDDLAGRARSKDYGGAGDEIGQDQEETPSRKKRRRA
jgi:transcriptional regulator with XRE-family HTH domain